MPGTSRTTLRNLLLSAYDEFARRLTRRLGSSELAAEALQETFLRLEHATEIGPVRNPRTYLYRIAVNIATDRVRSENRRLTDSEVHDMVDIADDAPDPARAAEARSDIEALKRALAELPERRRAIFIAARLAGTKHDVIAKKFGISVRTVEIELKDALAHCAQRLGRKLTKNFAPPRRGSSHE